MAAVATSGRRHRALPMRRRAAVLLAAPAVVAALAGCDSSSDHPPDASSTTSSSAASSDLPDGFDPVRDPSNVVHASAADDPLDAAASWVDITGVTFSDAVQPHWYIQLADGPPAFASLEPDRLIAYGLVLDTTGDGAADYLIGIDNDAPAGFHVWVTDLATTTTARQVGPPYGYPIEFSHPDETHPGGPPGPEQMVFTFLGGTAPAGFDAGTVRFYAWSAETVDGDLVASDFAPDTGWLDPPYGASPP